MDEDSDNLEEKEEKEEKEQSDKSHEEVEKEPSVEEEEIVDPRTLLTQEQVDYFKAIFDSFDTQNKGKITVKSIGIVLRIMGLNPTKAQIKAHFEEIDPAKKGVIDFPSFLLPIAQRINEEPESPQDILDAFKVLADDEDDYITTAQLHECLTTLGEDLEDFEIEILIKMAETKGTGLVHYRDFLERFLGLKKPPKASKKDSKKKKK